MTEEHLLPHEYRIVTLRRHPVVLARPAGEMLGALALGIWLTVASTVPPAAIWLAVGAVFLRFTWKVAYWASWSLVISNLRMLIISGLMTKTISQVALIRIIDMTFERTAMAQLLGYGTLSLKSAAHDHAFHDVAYLPRPSELYRLLSGLVFRDAELEGGQPR